MKMHEAGEMVEGVKDREYFYLLGVMLAKFC